MKKQINKALSVLVITLVVFALSGCGESYSKDDMERNAEEAYKAGYNAGYDCGASEQREKDCEEFLIDGTSIRELKERVYAEYGVTPSQAFNITEDYDFDSSHGGYSWAEYQNAIDAIYGTVSMFPSAD